MTQLRIHCYQAQAAIYSKTYSIQRQCLYLKLPLKQMMPHVTQNSKCCNLIGCSPGNLFLDFLRENMSWSSFFLISWQNIDSGLVFQNYTTSLKYRARHRIFCSCIHARAIFQMVLDRIHPANDFMKSVNCFQEVEKVAQLDQNGNVRGQPKRFPRFQ